MFIILKSISENLFHIMDYNDKKYFTTFCGKTYSKPTTISLSIDGKCEFICKNCLNHFFNLHRDKITPNFRYIKSSLLKTLMINLFRRILDKNSVYTKHHFSHGLKIHKLKYLLKNKK